MRVMPARQSHQGPKTRSRGKAFQNRGALPLRNAVGGFSFLIPRQRHTTSQMPAQRLHQERKTHSRTHRFSKQSSPSIALRGGRIFFFISKAKTHNTSDARAAVAPGTENTSTALRDTGRSLIVSFCLHQIHVQNKTSVLALNPLISNESTARSIAK